MRSILYVIFLFICTFPALAQTDAPGTIEGHLTTTDNAPAAFANVLLKGTRNYLVTVAYTF